MYFLLVHEISGLHQEYRYWMKNAALALDLS